VANKADFSIGHQVSIQAEGVVITMVWSAVVAFIAYKIVDIVIGLRVTEEEEREGLDISSTAKRPTAADPRAGRRVSKPSPLDVGPAA
jgi:ammonia channel protein AmtB